MTKNTNTAPAAPATCAAQFCKPATEAEFLATCGALTLALCLAHAEEAASYGFIVTDLAGQPV
jgi:hypothetical protein